MKAALILALIRWHRLGFLVGPRSSVFAVGTGFALGETLHYLRQASEASLGNLARAGLRHGDHARRRTAIFAGHGTGDAERSAGRRWRVLIPGYALAVGAALGLQPFFFSPFASALGVAVVLPLIVSVVSPAARRRGGVARQGFRRRCRDARADESGRSPTRPSWQVPARSEGEFHGPVVAVPALLRTPAHRGSRCAPRHPHDARQNGFEADVDAATREKVYGAGLSWRRASQDRPARDPADAAMSHKDCGSPLHVGK